MNALIVNILLNAFALNALGDAHLFERSHVNVKNTRLADSLAYKLTKINNIFREVTSSVNTPSIGVSTVLHPYHPSTVNTPEYS